MIQRLGTSLFALALMIIAGHAEAESFVFKGHVEPSKRAAVASELDAMVTEVLFSGGETVKKGQPLILLNAADAELTLISAEATVARDKAELTMAENRAKRQMALAARNVASEAAVGQASAALKIARAQLALSEAERDRAALNVERATIRAPISGMISKPNVVVGSFVEAESGPPLARIIAIDPVVVAYQAPYTDRLIAIKASDQTTVEALLQKIKIRIDLPSGHDYGLTVTPHSASADVDPRTGALTVWARFPNPDRILRPGMTVTVNSVLKTASR